ncbi:hypothetical protein ACFY1J_38620 [Streptomyces sp. NPDC001406]|uniref:hypothetical protein n=1 Tax=Streptomyces sp. NPDC001406 TaxID=3364572 RepID=UPI00367D3485
MRHPPRDPGERILDARRLSAIGRAGAVMAVGTVTLLALRRRTLLTATAAAGPAALLMGPDDAWPPPPPRPAPGPWTADRRPGTVRPGRARAAPRRAARPHRRRPLRRRLAQQPRPGPAFLRVQPCVRCAHQAGLLPPGTAHCGPRPHLGRGPAPRSQRRPQHGSRRSYSATRTRPTPPSASCPRRPQTWRRPGCAPTPRRPRTRRCRAPWPTPPPGADCAPRPWP